MTLEEYMAQSAQAYQPAKDAINTQINALGGSLDVAKQRINSDYENQQAELNRQRNLAARSAAFQAAASGGGFGGKAESAMRKYYENTFVPAQTRLDTSKADALSQAEQNYNNQLTSLNSQLSSLDAQAQQQALNQYWAAREAERNRQAQLQAQTAQNAYYQYLMDAAKEQNANNGVKTWDFGNGYKVYDDNGEAVYSLNGNQISRGQFLEGTGGNTKWDLWNDIWNSGTRTNGIGSDTIQAYKNFYQPNAPLTSGNNVSLRNSNKYGYLY